MGTFDQQEWGVRFEWGGNGIKTLAPISDVVIIVDVLRFTTTVTAAVERGATVFPYRWKDPTAHAYAKEMGAELFGAHGASRSLSPLSMGDVDEGTRLVLPSPNGSALSLEASDHAGVVLAGCMRNARAVAEAATKNGSTIALIAAGERWDHDGPLRPALEDVLGAGAIISHLVGRKSPEAAAAEGVFESCKDRLTDLTIQSASGKELTEKGYAADVAFAAELNSSSAVPILRDKAFVPWQG